MDPALKSARMQIVSEIGADVGSFTSPGEKRFTGAEAMAAIAGAMLYAFFKGMAKKIGEKVLEKVGEKVSEKVGEKVGEKIGGKIGDPLARFVGEKIEELTGKDKAAQDQLLEDARSEAKQQILRIHLTASEVTIVAQTIEGDMVEALSEKAPPDVSVRIARKVNSVAVTLL